MKKSIFVLVFLVSIFDLINVPVAGAQSACEKMVQGKIAWDYKGSKTWNPTNVNRLCKGAENSAEPGKCFNRVMHGGINWGGGTQWQWKNALDLCEGTLNANATIGCFERKIKAGVKWPQAIKDCGGSSPRNDLPVEEVSACEKMVQGKIAWDYKGSKTWNPTNVNRLCKGAENSAEPAKCFNRVMHEGIDYGGGTKWKWENALNLCEGTFNANATIGCFEEKIQAGIKWPQAIKECGGRLPVNGVWINKDPNTRSITKLNIKQSGTNISVHAWGKCSPKDCDWGTEKGTLSGRSATVTWDQGFAIKKMKILPIKNYQLQVTTDAVYNDKRPRQKSTDYFVKE